ncbi:MAG: site-specific integrase [Balneolaceae bacterium]
MATTLHFYLRKDFQKKNGEYPIYLRITSNRKNKYISTGLSVSEKDWNFRDEKFRRSHRNYKALNKTLKFKLEEAENAQAELVQYGKDSAREIRERLEINQKADFFLLADEYLEEKKKAKKLYAIKNSKVVFNKIEEYQGERELPLKQIDTDYLESFEHHLRTKYDNSDTTINKNFEPIRAIIKKALRTHLISKDPFRNFEGAKRKPPKKKTKLSIDQIRAIENLKLEPGSWTLHVRNAFMFSFYSGGIRFGDMCCLKWKNISDGRLSYTMNKNDKPFSTALNEFQQDILNLYSGDSNEFIFPFLDNTEDYTDPMELRKEINKYNVTANKHLDKIVKKLNKQVDEKKINVRRIDGNVTFHVSRHSFAQHAVQSGLGLYELMQTLRHTKIETTERYLKGLDEELADKAMKKVF